MARTRADFDALIKPYKPCLVEFEHIGLTIYLHEDVAYYAKPVSKEPHGVDALLAMDDNRLVGMQVWTCLGMA